MPGEFIGLVAVICIFGTPMVAILTNHQRRLAEIRAKTRSGEGSALAEMQELKREFMELRDTTTRYDLSFDAALQRLESRVGNLESRLGPLEAQSQSSSAQALRG
jgi:hypothetical protein